MTYTEKENLHAGSSLAVIFGEGSSQDEFYLKNIVSQLSRDPAPEDPSKPDEPPMEKPGEGPDEPPQDPKDPDEKRQRKSPRITPRKSPPKRPGKRK